MSDIFNMTDTWNAGGTTFTAIKMNVTDTASAAGSLLMDLQVGGSSKFSVSKGGRVGFSDGTAAVASIGRIASETGFSFRNATQIDVLHNGVATGNLGSSWWKSPTLLWIGDSDTILTRDAANTLAQRNGANAQAFRVYNTYTDGSNYERGFFQWAGNVLQIGFEAAGTGSTGRITVIRGSSTGGVRIDNGANIGFEVRGGHFLSLIDNTYDIGASGATRPRMVYAANGVAFAAGGRISGVNGNDILTLYNAAVSGAPLLQFGGATASFPSLKRATVNLEARLADDSDYAGLKGKHIAHANAVAETPTATHTLRMFDAAGTEYKVLAVAA